MTTVLIAKRLAWLALAASAAFSSLISYSQTRSSTLAETMVTATRTEQPLADLVADVTVIDRSEIERGGATGLADVLVRVPGIEMIRNGGPGNRTDVYIRGAETRFTAVFVDGVRVDSQSTGGAPWEAIPLAQIERLEIVRGPAGAVYGSDALGGVIQIFTRKGQGPLAPYAGIGLGSYGTRKWEAGFSGAEGQFDYALGVAREASSGFNARPVSTQNPDDDGYVSESLSGRLGWQLNAAHRLEASMLSSNLDAQYDTSATKDDHAMHLLQTKGLNWRGKWSDSYSTQLSVTESRAQYETKPSVYLTMTRLNGYLFQNEFRLGAHLLTAALERKVDFLENRPTNPINRERAQDALALGYGWRSNRHSLQMNLRHDQDSEFGGQDTGSAAYGFALTPQWRATASVGSAFRAPTLYHRFSAYGVSTLQAETSVNQELGLRYAQGSSQWSLVTYRNRVSNLITFSSPGPCASATGCYANTAQAEFTGVTLSARQRLGEVNLQASLDVQEPRDSVSGKLLKRRASHHANLAADTRAGTWLVGAGVQLSGARYDEDANTVVLPGYSLFNLHASRRIDKDWSLLARIDNLGDSRYQLVKDYATPGRSLYVALKWAPQ
ncbi:MAG: TonB-dependent receptor [Curvibacter sp. GWA2_64_110]|nr:MAG: TonB-dependent receptor [Curvibacter sp. GWA2_64_110]HCY16530.1 TonB-dependent receptor [Curvibacter sp.]